MLNLCHDDPTAGHLGRDKTLAKLSERYWWHGFRKDVSRYVASCESCQRRKLPSISPFTEIHPTQPPQAAFELIGLDHLGPFPKSQKGNRFIIVAVDHLTKWIELRAVPTTSANHIVEFLREQIVLRHGVPRTVLTDRGTPFSSRIFKHEMVTHRIHHAHSAPYHPQTNGLVERANRTIADILYAYVNASHDNWDVYVPYASFALNTSQQASTTTTPFKLVYGRTPVLPQESTLSTTWNHRRQEMSDHFEDRLNEARRRARVAITRAQQRMLTNHRQDDRMSPIVPGDLVLVRRPVRRKGKATKLLPKYKGPCEVLRQTGPVSYRLRDLNASREASRTFPAHRSQLKLYVSRHTFSQDQHRTQTAEDGQSTRRGQNVTVGH